MSRKSEMVGYYTGAYLSGMTRISISVNALICSQESFPVMIRRSHKFPSPIPHSSNIIANYERKTWSRK